MIALEEKREKKRPDYSIKKSCYTNNNITLMKYGVLVKGEWFRLAS